MTTQELEQIQSIVDAIRTSFKLQTAIVYGSNADGTATAESDIDLLLVLDDDRVHDSYMAHINSRLEIRQHLRDAGVDRDIDLLVYTKPKWAVLERSGSSFIRQIAAQGIRL